MIFFIVLIVVIFIKVYVFGIKVNLIEFLNIFMMLYRKLYFIFLGIILGWLNFIFFIEYNLYLDFLM